jgi:hypothetical protein
MKVVLNNFIDNFIDNLQVDFNLPWNPLVCNSKKTINSCMYIKQKHKNTCKKKKQQINMS